VKEQTFHNCTATVIFGARVKHLATGIAEGFEEAESEEQVIEAWPRPLAKPDPSVDREDEER
jgi:hypothetical protein